MENIHAIMYASMACWSGIGLYIFFLARKQSSLVKRINRLSSLMERDI